MLKSLFLAFLDWLYGLVAPERTAQAEAVKKEAEKRHAENAAHEKRIAESRAANKIDADEAALLATEEAVEREALEQIEKQREALKREKKGTVVLSDSDAVRVDLGL